MNNQLILSADEEKDQLKNDHQFIGYKGDKLKPNSILIKNNNLHIEIVFDPNSMVGKNDKASISDIIMESAL